MSQIKIEVTTTEQHLEEVAALTSPANSELEVKFLSWEYQNLQSRSPLFVLRDSEKKMIGAQGFISIALQHKGKSIRSSKSETSFLARGERGKGSFEILYSKGLELVREKGIELVWGFTSAGKLWKEKLGFEVKQNALFESSLILKWNKQIVHQKSPVSKLLRKIAFYLPLIFRPSIQSDIELYHSSCATHAIVRWLESRTYSGIYLTLSESYLKWRLDQNPNCEYTYHWAEREGQITGVSISTITPNGELRIVFIDAETEDNEMQMISALIQKFRAQSNIWCVRYWGNPSHPSNGRIFDEMSKLGASNYSLPLYFVTKHLSRNSFSAESSYWYINGLWTEGRSF